jgi:glycosyltransferase involved in cell wall biosynthesis
MQVACCLIVKGTPDEAPLLANALASINGYVDYIVVQANSPKDKEISKEVKEVASQYADVYYEYEWEGNYVKAREDCFSMAPQEADWLLFLDSDDTVDVPEMIKPSLEIMPKDVGGVYISYDYDHDDFGNVTINLWSCRVVRNNGTFHWKSSFDDDEISVHETLVAKTSSRSVSNNEWAIIHHADKNRREVSLERNVELLEGMYKKHSEKGDVDPRILYYLATHYYDQFRFNECKQLLYEYLQLSGWSEERSEAHVYMGKILLMEKKYQQARIAFLMAIGEYSKNANSYLELAELELRENRYQQAYDWLITSAEIKQDITPMVKFNNTYLVYSLLCQTLMNIGGKKLNEAREWAVKALKLRPYDPNAQALRDQIDQLIDYRDNMKAANRIIRKLEQDKDEENILPLIKHLPKDLQDTVPVVDARNRYTEPKVWPYKSIAIYCGSGALGIWGPHTMDTKGMGGSEEAVIRLSRELDKLGWKVTVYATPGESAGFDGGVEWKQYWEFNPKDEFDILIGWRSPWFYDAEFTARKKYLWMHDLTPQEEFTTNRVNNFDKAIFVSQYHANEYKDVIPNQKRFASSNGINSDEFDKYDGKFKRNPYRCIYMSANERGLRILYDIWEDVKKEVPEAILDIYYGWESFDSVNRDNPERMMWKAQMIDKASKLDGVTEHGRIGQDKLVQEIFKSGIWAYPTFFPEVNCITCQKAMAAGAIPVTSDFAVLKDIIAYGEQIPMNKFEQQDIDLYKSKLISWLKSPKRQENIREEMAMWARTHFDWSNTANQWAEEMS